MTNRRLAMERLLHVDTVDAGAKAAARKPRTAGAVRAMGLTLAQSEASADGRNVQEIEPSLCDPSFARDRLGEGGAYQSEDDGIEAFAESIADGGQVVPILVRPHPDAKGRYQIAYGHRRVRACARLGQPVRAIVAALSDDDLIVAQGRENNERRDLTFIERAHFARTLAARRISRATIAKALGVDKTELARLLAVASGLPDGLAERLGRAPRIGRPRWLKLVDLCRDREPNDVLALADQVVATTSDDRFKALLAALEAPAPSSTRPVLQTAGLAHSVKRAKRTTTITIDRSRAPGFDSFLEGRLERLYAEYLEFAGHPTRAE